MRSDISIDVLLFLDNGEETMQGVLAMLPYYVERYVLSRPRYQGGRILLAHYADSVHRFQGQGIMKGVRKISVREIPSLSFEVDMQGGGFGNDSWHFVLRLRG